MSSTLRIILSIVLVLIIIACVVIIVLDKTGKHFGMHQLSEKDADKMKAVLGDKISGQFVIKGGKVYDEDGNEIFTDGDAPQFLKDVAEQYDIQLNGTDNNAMLDAPEYFRGMLDGMNSDEVNTILDIIDMTTLTIPVSARVAMYCQENNIAYNEYYTEVIVERILEPNGDDLLEAKNKKEWDEIIKETVEACDRVLTDMETNTKTNPENTESQI